MSSRVLAHIRGRLVRGLLLVLPLLITVWMVRILFDLVNRTLTPWVARGVEWAGFGGVEGYFPRLVVPFAGLLLTAAMIYVLGLVAGNLVGRRIVAQIEALILRIPMVKWIYGSSRQLLDAFSMTGTKTFSKVVLLEYPRRGLWTVGFVTSEVEHRLQRSSGDPVEGAVPVFLATTPNPTSGWMILVPTAELFVLEMTVEEGIKLIVSGGIVGPENLGPLVRQWPTRGPAEAR